MFVTRLRARHAPAKLACAFAPARTAQHKPMAVGAALALMSYISRARAHLLKGRQYLLQRVRVLCEVSHRAAAKCICQGAVVLCEAPHRAAETFLLPALCQVPAVRCRRCALALRQTPATRNGTALIREDLPDCAWFKREGECGVKREAASYCWQYFHTQISLRRRPLALGGARSLVLTRRSSIPVGLAFGC